MNKFKKSYWKIIPLVIGFLTALIPSYFVASAISSSNTSKELRDNCTSFVSPKDVGKDTFLDTENLLVRVSWTQGDGKDVNINLPYDINGKFDGCSADAKNVLTEVKQVYDSYVRESCADFKSLIAGRKPLPVKGGEKPNIDNLKVFVSKYCK